MTETLIKEILLACPGANIKTELGDKGTTTVARGIQPAHGPARFLIDSKVCNLVPRALNIKKNILNLFEYGGGVVWSGVGGEEDFSKPLVA